MSQKIIDHHMHTNWSPDADPNLTFEDYIHEAIHQNIPGVMFTDHVDFDYPDPFFKDIIDYQKYFEHIEKYRNLNTIEIGMGVEMGYQPHLKIEMDQFLKRHPFDFVICSIHVCDQLDLYNGDFFKGKTQQEAYRRYFEIVLEAVQNYDNYDIFGHVDYIIRYGNYSNRDYDYNLFKDIIDDILLAIIKKGKGIEVNTSGLRYGLGVMHPKQEVIHRYKQLGGQIITIGSDAHYIKDFQKDVDAALKLIKNAGFTQITYFKSRKPQQIPI
jgi:histidinol-phosphatase (PHP family)